MNLNEEIDEDILNDASNLFIDDDENDGSSLELRDNAKSEIVPIVPLPKQPEPKINLLKIPIEKQQPQKQQKDIEAPVVEDKITPPITKPVIEKPTITKENKPKGNTVTKDNVDNKKSDKIIVVSKCKNDSDCDSNSFCITKTGKCTPKLELNQSGCTSNDQCSDPIAVCHSKTCKLSCKVGNDEMCKSGTEGHGCVEVKDLKLFQEFKGKFNGVCDMVAKGKEAPAITRPQKSTMSTSSALLISGSAGIILTILIICFIYFRGRLKRRHRNTNPDMFLFNKLQRHASQSLAMAQKSNSAERLNMRLSSVGGARFTRWAALSNETAPGSGY